ncbi:hypothetical protein PIB30_072273 [Stylosanthes scabra]|uniref:Secreted protein n=1 Tax=Stylosanthes scabra TaxID=79078 RepID=A0ABU6UQ28_9FABA|nr:hypothetical protein [Stylosanthes scabra]
MMVAGLHGATTAVGHRNRCCVTGIHHRHYYLVNVAAAAGNGRRNCYSPIPFGISEENKFAAVSLSIEVATVAAE